jgi:predicted metal-dependent HD superfamily phosphohydrolase
MTAPAPAWLPPALLAAVQAAYAAPPRAYHHFGHVQEVLRDYHDVAASDGWRQPDEVYLAVLCHDAVYVAGASDNEARSAALARELVAQHLPDRGLDVDAIARLVELTARHGKLSGDALDHDARLFLDCDMAILGAAPERYDDYEAAIALEYAAVPSPLFRAGRAAFLAGLLAQPRIFLSDRFHDSHDAPARANLRRAHAALT